MHRVVGLSVVLATVLSANAALAQTATTTLQPASGPSSVGVDVWSTLYPRPPQSTITQPTLRAANQPVTSGPVQPVGINAGNVIWYPSITGATFYDDNVFARSSNRVGDWAAIVRPELAWRSNNWANAQVGADAFIEKRWYRQFKSEDQLNGAAQIGGTAQPDANTQLVGRLAYLHAHEDRGTSDSVNTSFARPLAYDQFEAAGAINKRFDRVWTSLGAAGAWIHFQDPTLNGLTISQAYRNGAIVRVPARVGYVIAPSTSVFGEVSVNRRDFRDDAFDSRGYRVVGGMLFEPGAGSRLKGEVFAGYMAQNYNGASFQKVSTWTFGSSLAVLVANNVTAVFEGRRDAREASLSGGQVPGDGVSVVETMAAVRADVLVAPNFVIGGGVAYLSDQYLGANRTDRSWSPLASAKYFVNRNLTLGFDYRYLTFDSSGLGVNGYYKNVYLFSANLRY